MKYKMFFDRIKYIAKNINYYFKNGKYIIINSIVKFSLYLLFLFVSDVMNTPMLLQA